MTKWIVLIIGTLFILSLIPFFKISLNGGYSFAFRRPVLKKMDKMPGIWMHSTTRVNLWVYLDAKRKGMLGGLKQEAKK